jgi:hypothetical protein
MEAVQKAMLGEKISIGHAYEYMALGSAMQQALYRSKPPKCQEAKNHANRHRRTGHNEQALGEKRPKISAPEGI